MRRLGIAGLALVVGCASTSVLEAPRPRLGVQSNEVPIGAITLRFAPSVGTRFRTSLAIDLTAQLMGQSMELSGVYEDEREVLERRPDGTTVMASRTTGRSYRIALGDMPARDEPIQPSERPTTSVLDARGRSIEDAMFAPEVPGGSTERSALLRGVLDPLLDALAYPEESLDPGDHWDGVGSRTLPEGGTLRYELTQTLVRVEGSGANAVAVVAVRGRLDGADFGGGGPSSGELRIDGVYTVGVADGLVRAMQTRIDGRVAIGGVGPSPRGRGQPSAGGLDVPFEGTIRYRAE
jgi:hypothetical protein